MAEIITAAEAKEAVKARKLAKEETYVAGLIDDAINAEKYECSHATICRHIQKALHKMKINLLSKL